MTAKKLTPEELDKLDADYEAELRELGDPDEGHEEEDKWTWSYPENLGDGIGEED